MMLETQHPICETCTYWETPINKDKYNVIECLFGKCTATIHMPDMTDWKDINGDGNYYNVIVPKFLNTTAIAYDASSYYAGLLTRKDHYCPMHSFLASPKSIESIIDNTSY